MIWLTVLKWLRSNWHVAAVGTTLALLVGYIVWLNVTVSSLEADIAQARLQTELATQAGESCVSDVQEQNQAVQELKEAGEARQERKAEAVQQALKPRPSLPTPDVDSLNRWLETQ